MHTLCKNSIYIQYIQYIYVKYNILLKKKKIIKNSLLFKIHDKEQIITAVLHTIVL